MLLPSNPIISGNAIITDSHKLRIGTTVLVTPFHLPNGDGISIFSDPNGDFVRLADGGNTVRYLRQRPVDITAERRTEMRAIAEANEVLLIDNELAVDVLPNDIAGGVASLVQAILQASAMSFGLSDHAASPFAVAIDRAIMQLVAPVRPVEKRWHHPKKDRERLWPVDYRLEGAGLPSRNIFVVTGKGPASRVASALLFIREEKIGGDSLVLVDLGADVRGRPLKRLQYAADEIAFGDEADAVRDRMMRFALP